MTDPVCDKDGHAYERTAILQRLANGASVSPISKAPLTATDLTTDHALKYSFGPTKIGSTDTSIWSTNIFSLFY
eukprot:COSAG02_NODE_633_length_19262_cov_32.473256_8_plen_74_part_00